MAYDSVSRVDALEKEFPHLHMTARGDLKPLRHAQSTVSRAGCGSRILLFAFTFLRAHDR